LIKDRLDYFIKFISLADPKIAKFCNDVLNWDALF